MEEIAALRERIQGAAVELSWIPALQKDTRTRNGHASTAIEGNPLTLEQVRALEEGREPLASAPHHRREVTNYFADGNGRTGRALALWELYRRGFDSHHIFSVDEYYWENRPAYYAALAQVHKAGGVLSQWLEYSALGLRQTLEQVWKRVLRFQTAHPEKIALTPKQEHLLGLIADHGNLAPAQIRKLLDVSKQGAMNVLNPLIQAGLVEKHGTNKSGKYRIR